MFTRILVPLDGTSFAESMLPSAIQLAKRCGASILLVRVVDIFREAHADSSAKLEATAYLRQIAERLQAEGVRFHLALSSEWPADGILDEAEEYHADLIAMRTHGRLGIEALLHPSVTWQVFRASHAPILCWKREQAPDTPEETPALPRFMVDPQAPVLVPLDGSPQAERALPVARAFAQIFGNPLLLVRAAEEPFLPGAGVDYPQALTRAEERILAEAREYLYTRQQELKNLGLTVENEAALGMPVSFIEEMVKQRQVGLIVMAAHGRSGPGRRLLGSTARSLLSQAEVPVVLVRSELTEADTLSWEADSFQEATGTKRS